MTNSLLQTILITGASSGLGAELALAYSTPERVLFLTARNKERLDSVAQSCRARGATVVAKVLDVTESYAMRQWINEIDEQHPIDLVIANAGVSAGTGQGLLESDAQVREIFSTNVMGVFNTVHPVIEQMKKRGHGQVALISSMAGFRGLPGAPAYGAAKAAVRSYGEGLRGSLSQFGINVSVICPGFVDTPMTRVNPYKMPFLMEAPKAAQIIKRGLEKNIGRIAFPLPMLIGVWFINLLPDCVANALLSHMPGKPEQKQL